MLNKNLQFTSSEIFRQAEKEVEEKGSIGRKKVKREVIGKILDEVFSEENPHKNPFWNYTAVPGETFFEKWFGWTS